MGESLSLKKPQISEDAKVTIENFDNLPKLLQVQVQSIDECFDADGPSISSKDKDEDENCKSNSSILTNSKCKSSGVAVASDCAGVVTKNVVVTVHDEKDKDLSVTIANNTSIQSASASRVAAALLGSCAASTTSLSSIVTATTAFRNSSARHRHRAIINADDLSSPYNHYRRLSPNEHYGKYIIIIIINTFTIYYIEKKRENKKKPFQKIY